MVKAALLSCFLSVGLRADASPFNDFERDHVLTHMGACALAVDGIHFADTPFHRTYPVGCAVVEYAGAVALNWAYLQSPDHSPDERVWRFWGGAVGAALPLIYARW